MHDAQRLTRARGRCSEVTTSDPRTFRGVFWPGPTSRAGGGRHDRFSNHQRDCLRLQGLYGPKRIFAGELLLQWHTEWVTGVTADG